MNAKKLLVRIFFSAAITATPMSVSSFETMTYRAGSEVISAEDSVARLISALGDSSSKEAVTNIDGAQLATNWYYVIDGKTVRFLITEGKVRSIEGTR